MTVCRVVRGHRGVATSTASRVQAAIQKLGYRPDPALSALAAYRQPGSGKGSVIAFLQCEDTTYNEIICEGARREAKLLGYSLQTFPLEADSKKNLRLARTLFHRGIKGLLLGPSSEMYDLRQWDWTFFTAVSLSAMSHEPAMNAVTMDYFDAAARSVEYLSEQGSHRQALVVAPHLEARTRHQWKGGFAALSGVSAFIYESENLNQPLRSWLKKHQIDGIATIHKIVSEQATRLNLPCIFLNEYEAPEGVARFSLSPDLIGAEGLRMLHHQLLRGSHLQAPGGTTTILKGRLSTSL